jgi:hypothetical protein
MEMRVLDIYRGIAGDDARLSVDPSANELDVLATVNNRANPRGVDRAFEDDVAWHVGPTVRVWPNLDGGAVWRDRSRPILLDRWVLFALRDCRPAGEDFGRLSASQGRPVRFLGFVLPDRLTVASTERACIRRPKRTDPSDRLPL